MTKREFRRIVLDYRRLLDKAEFERRNAKLCHHLTAFMTECNPGCVHSFLSITRNNEPDVLVTLKEWTRQGGRMVISRTDFETKKMDHILFDEDLQFDQDRFGIPEPRGGQEIDISEIDMILVPLLAFDRTGNRIGYGGGYYDRLLVDLPEHVDKVGLSLTGSVDHLPVTEKHDIALDACITPFQIVKFK